MKSRIVVLIALATLCVTAFASGAPWYKWKNITDHTEMCSQNRPGDVWVVFQGPFMESRCVKHGYPQ